MTPGGHLLTTVAACGVTYAMTGSLPLTLGVAAGGFGIDVDHAIDYVIFERQRNLSPDRFLRYCLEGKNTFTVLMLHSYELMALLALAAWWTGGEWLIGYLLGAAMHLPLDIIFNGESYLKFPLRFYSFVYRWRLGFSTAKLSGRLPRLMTPKSFWTAFFKGAAVGAPEGRPASASLRRIDSQAESEIL